MGILPFEKLIEYNIFFMHSIHYDYAPSSFRNIFPKNCNREIIYELRNAVPAARIELFKKFPLFTFPTAWNSVAFLPTITILSHFKEP